MALQDMDPAELEKWRFRLQQQIQLPNNEYPNLTKMTTQLKTLGIASKSFFQIPDQIHDKIWVGGLTSGVDAVGLNPYNFTHVVCLMTPKETPPAYAAGLNVGGGEHVKCLVMEVEDGNNESLLGNQYVEKLQPFLDEAVATETLPTQSPTKILIHCRMGVNRSCSVAAAYLISHYKYSLWEAVAKVMTARRYCFLNKSFRDELIIYAHTCDKLDVLPVNSDDFVFKKFLGRGVFLCHYKSGKSYCVVRAEKENGDIVQENTIAKDLKKHSAAGVPLRVGTDENTKKKFAFLPFCPGESVRSILRRRDTSQETKAMFLDEACKIARAFERAGHCFSGVWSERLVLFKSSKETRLRVIEFGPVRQGEPALLSKDWTFASQSFALFVLELCTDSDPLFWSYLFDQKTNISLQRAFDLISAASLDALGLRGSPAALSDLTKDEDFEDPRLPNPVPLKDDVLHPRFDEAVLKFTSMADHICQKKSSSSNIRDIAKEVAERCVDHEQLGQVMHGMARSKSCKTHIALFFVDAVLRAARKLEGKFDPFVKAFVQPSCVGLKIPIVEDIVYRVACEERANTSAKGKDLHDKFVTIISQWDKYKWFPGQENLLQIFRTALHSGEKKTQRLGERAKEKMEAAKQVDLFSDLMNEDKDIVSAQIVQDKMALEEPSEGEETHVNEENPSPRNLEVENEEEPTFFAEFAGKKSASRPTSVKARRTRVESEVQVSSSPEKKAPSRKISVQSSQKGEKTDVVPLKGSEKDDKKKKKRVRSQSSNHKKNAEVVEKKSSSQKKKTRSYDEEEPAIVRGRPTSRRQSSKRVDAGADDGAVSVADSENSKSSGKAASVAPETEAVRARSEASSDAEQASEKSSVRDAASESEEEEESEEASAVPSKKKATPARAASSGSEQSDAEKESERDESVQSKSSAKSESASVHSKNRRSGGSRRRSREARAGRRARPRSHAVRDRRGGRHSRSRGRGGRRDARRSRSHGGRGRGGRRSRSAHRRGGRSRSRSSHRSHRSRRHHSRGRRSRSRKDHRGHSRSGRRKDTRGGSQERSDNEKQQTRRKNASPSPAPSVQTKTASEAADEKPRSKSVESSATESSPSRRNTAGVDKKADDEESHASQSPVPPSPGSRQSDVVEEKDPSVSRSRHSKPPSVDENKDAVTPVTAPPNSSAPIPQTAIENEALISSEVPRLTEKSKPPRPPPQEEEMKDAAGSTSQFQEKAKERGRAASRSVSASRSEHSSSDGASLTSAPYKRSQPASPKNMENAKKSVSRGRSRSASKPKSVTGAAEPEEPGELEEPKKAGELEDPKESGELDDPEDTDEPAEPKTGDEREHTEKVNIAEEPDVPEVPEEPEELEVRAEADKAEQPQVAEEADEARSATEAEEEVDETEAASDVEAAEAVRSSKAPSQSRGRSQTSREDKVADASERSKKSRSPSVYSGSEHDAESPKESEKAKKIVRSRSKSCASSSDDEEDAKRPKQVVTLKKVRKNRGDSSSSGSSSASKSASPSKSRRRDNKRRQTRDEIADKSSSESRSKSRGRSSHRSKSKPKVSSKKVDKKNRHRSESSSHSSKSSEVPDNKKMARDGVRSSSSESNSRGRSVKRRKLNATRAVRKSASTSRKGSESPKKDKGKVVARDESSSSSESNSHDVTPKKKPAPPRAASEYSSDTGKRSPSVEKHSKKVRARSKSSSHASPSKAGKSRGRKKSASQSSKSSVHSQSRKRRQSTRSYQSANRIRDETPKKTSMPEKDYAKPHMSKRRETSSPSRSRQRNARRSRSHSNDKRRNAASPRRAGATRGYRSRSRKRKHDSRSPMRGRNINIYIGGSGRRGSPRRRRRSGSRRRGGRGRRDESVPPPPRRAIR